MTTISIALVLLFSPSSFLAPIICPHLHQHFSGQFALDVSLSVPCSFCVRLAHLVPFTHSFPLTVSLPLSPIEVVTHAEVPDKGINSNRAEHASRHSLSLFSQSLGRLFAAAAQTAFVTAMIFCCCWCILFIFCLLNLFCILALPPPRPLDVNGLEGSDGRQFYQHRRQKQMRKFTFSSFCFSTFSLVVVIRVLSLSVLRLLLQSQRLALSLRAPLSRRSDYSRKSRVFGAAAAVVANI